MKLLFTIGLSVFASTVLAQTAILTPQGGYLCGQVGSAQFCSSSELGSGFTILPLGPQTYTVTPMAPTMPQYDEPKERRESSTPMFLGASEAKSERLFDVESPKVPCYSLFREC